MEETAYIQEREEENQVKDEVVEVGLRGGAPIYKTIHHMVDRPVLCGAGTGIIIDETEETIVEGIFRLIPSDLHPILPS